MDIIKLFLLMVATALLCASLRVQKPELAMALSMAAGAMAFLWALQYVREAVDALGALAGGAGLSENSISIMLRAAGVTLLSEFASQLCRDAGEGALAGRVEFGARAALFAMSVPLITSLAGRIAQLLP